MGRILVDSLPSVLVDNFTDTNNVSIASHTPNTQYSGGWTQTVSNAFYIQSNTLQPDRYSDGDLAIIESGLSDLTISATVVPFSTSGNRGYPGLVFRYLDASNFWYVFPDSDNSLIQVYSVENGSHKQRIRYSFINASGTSIDIKITCKGTNIILFVNGIEIVTYVSSFNQTATKVGVRCGKSGSPASKPSWDSLIVQPYQGINLNWPLFTEYASGPIVALGAGGTWDSTDINNPTVFYDTANSRWTLSYSGYKTGTGNVQAMGLSYASSLLGPWTKEAGNPVFTGGGSYGQNGGIVKKGTTYYYYYGSNGASQISLATSTDLINWVDQGTVLTGTAGKWDSSGIFDAFARLRDDGATIELWYAGGNATGRAIGYATSTNGTTFTKYDKPVLLPKPFDGSLFTLGEPTVWIPPNKERSQMLASYDAALASSPNSRFIAQAITIDAGTSWHWRTGALELQSYSWENAQVFDNFVMTDSNIMYLFHSGAPNAGAALDLAIQIGVASAPFPFNSLINY